MWFDSGKKLADQQDNLLGLIEKGVYIPSKMAKLLEKNLWIMLASKIAPGNLVIRQWCIIDIIEEVPMHLEKITKMMDLLSYKNNNKLRIYAEGYSYFLYTMKAINLWIKKFEIYVKMDALKELIYSIQLGFLNTSYERDGVKYPAPFGDLRNEPLKMRIETNHFTNYNESKIIISNIKVYKSQYKNHYNISAKPLGLNTHIPKENFSTDVIDGCLTNFKFYEGYDKKYKNKFEELKDVFSLKRILSIFSL